LILSGFPFLSNGQHDTWLGALLLVGPWLDDVSPGWARGPWRSKEAIRQQSEDHFNGYATEALLLFFLKEGAAHLQAHLSGSKRVLPGWLWKRMFLFFR
jgi:hypothetical protein